MLSKLWTEAKVKTRRRITAILLAVAVPLTGAIAFTVGADGASKYPSFCVNKKTQAVFMREKCLKTEKTYEYSEKGDSAFQTWLSLGNKGTEQDFIAALKGKDGRDGYSGSDGKAAFEFATTCYQKLMQADQAGYIWRNSADLTRFESSTGCKVREIDLNPSTHVAGGAAWPRITSAKFLASGPTAAGDGGWGSVQEVGVAQGLYEITANVQSPNVLCSLSEYNRVLKHPSNGKTYAMGFVSGNHLNYTTNLLVGYGAPANSVEYDTNVEEDTYTAYRIDNGEVEIDLEFPRVIPLGATVELRVKRIRVMGSNVNLALADYFGPIGDSSFPLYGGVLARIVGDPTVVGGKYVYQIEANAFEVGKQIIRVGSGADAIQVPVFIGVANCEGQSEVVTPIPWDSWVYSFYETTSRPRFQDSDPNFAPSLGWTWHSWFPEE